jgi:hypothetical protein
MKKCRYISYCDGLFKNEDEDGNFIENFIVVIGSNGKTYCRYESGKRGSCYVSSSDAEKFLEKGIWKELDKNPFAKRKS